MIEPSQVYAEAKKRENENYRFRTFLKNNADHDELDKQFFELHHELFSGYDCGKCNNCCREYSTTIPENEAGAIAAFLGLTKQGFTEKYLIRSVEGHELKAPCCFLKENGGCAIEECKPAECVGFPYTDKPERLQSLLGVIKFAEVCPIVFEMLERLKISYRFRARRKGWYARLRNRL